jgi:DNA-directed RNA polymerase subunit RPC12/RpoP
MTAAISYFIAGVSTFTLFVLWFLNAYQVLSRKKQDVLHAEEQVRLLRECFYKMRNSPEEASAGRMLETSIQIYIQVEKIYNETLLKPICRVPGFLMGFRKVEGDWEIKEEDQMAYICEDCGFVFYGAGEIRECPYCGKQQIRVLAEEEISPLQPFLEWQNLGLGIKEEQR